MRRILLLTLFFFIFAVLIGAVFWYRDRGQIEQRIVESVVTTLPPTATPTPVPITPAPVSHVLPQGRFVSQSFNNCGPAALSMMLSHYGTDVDQETLADRMRPFHNPLGGVDDKSIFAQEFVTYAKEYGYEALERPNGDLELLKTFIANGFPVILRTWLHPNEDIGHFRIVRGYNDETQTLIQDDSYEGSNLTYSYDTFLSMWQPFNYGYILIYPKEKQALVNAILGEERDPKAAYRNSISRAEREVANDPAAYYPYFNIATASYHLGDTTGAIENYEKASASLPPRMLWYQIEPIQAYLKNGQNDTVLSLTDRILYNGNLAYSELYQMRGEVYRKQGNMDAARAEFEKAVYYNVNYQPAKDALNTLTPSS